MGYQIRETQDPWCLQVGPPDPEHGTPKCLGGTQDLQKGTRDPWPQNIQMKSGIQEPQSATRVSGPQNI